MQLLNTSLLLLLHVFAFNAEEAKIRFLESSDRPTQDPAKTSTRRFLTDATNERCNSVGNTAGALTAKLLIKEGTLIKDEDVIEEDTRAIVDVGPFVEMAVGYSGNALGFDTSCPRPLIVQAAAHMCLTILCRTPEKQSNAVASASVSDFFSNVRRSMPRSIEKKCEAQHFRFNSESSGLFNSNPQDYIRKLTENVAETTLETLKIQKKHKEKPIEAPPKVSDKNLDYYLSTLTGVTIASHVSKELVNIGEVTRGKAQGGLELTKLIGKIVDKILSQLLFVPKRSAYKVSNVAIKMSLFWILNNFQLVQKNSPNALTNATLANLGLLGEIKGIKLTTNNEPVDSKNAYIIIRQRSSKMKLLKKLVAKISCERVRTEILQKTGRKVPEVSGDVIRLVYEPVTTLKSVITIAAAATETAEDTEKVTVGTLPQPQLWYSTKAPIEGQNFDITLTGALAAIVGSHSAEILPKFGLITMDDEPGYSGLESIDIYEVLQEINMKLTAKLMLILPFSLKTGFQILTGAFKASKFALNLKDLPNNFGRGKSYIYIPLSFKKFGIIEFFPDLQHLQLDLIPLPRNNKPLRLWVKGHFDTNVRTLIQERLENIVDQEITDVLKDVLNIFSAKAPGLSIFKLGELQQLLQGTFTWDPPEIMSFVYEPPIADGVLEDTIEFKKVPKRPIQCPGHYLCSDDLNANIPLYSCTTLDPWCYFPNNVTCPSDIHCPVELNIKGQKIICPDNPNCPVVNIPCPGNSECPDETTICPGHPSCPLEIKCPGKACPQRFTTKSQFLMPCPKHPQCNQQPIPNQLVCTNATSCAYANMVDMHTALQEMEQNILYAIQSKNMTVNIETKAVANVVIMNNQTEDGNSSIKVNAVATSKSRTTGNTESSSTATSSAENGEGRASSAAAAAASQGKPNASGSSASASAASKPSTAESTKKKPDDPSSSASSETTEEGSQELKKSSNAPSDENKSKRPTTPLAKIGGSKEPSSVSIQGIKMQTKQSLLMNGENISEKPILKLKEPKSKEKIKASSTEEDCSNEGNKSEIKQSNVPKNSTKPISHQSLNKNSTATLQDSKKRKGQINFTQGEQKGSPISASGSFPKMSPQRGSPSGVVAPSASSLTGIKENGSQLKATVPVASLHEGYQKGSLNKTQSISLQGSNNNNTKVSSPINSKGSSSQKDYKKDPESSTSLGETASGSQPLIKNTSPSSTGSADSSQQDNKKVPLKHKQDAGGKGSSSSSVAAAASSSEESSHQEIKSSATSPTQGIQKKNSPSGTTTASSLVNQKSSAPSSAAAAAASSSHELQQKEQRPNSSLTAGNSSKEAKIRNSPIKPSNAGSTTSVDKRDKQKTVLSDDADLSSSTSASTEDEATSALSVATTTQSLKTNENQRPLAPSSATSAAASSSSERVEDEMTENSSSGRQEKAQPPSAVSAVPSSGSPQDREEESEHPISSSATAAASSHSSKSDEDETEDEKPSNAASVAASSETPKNEERGHSSSASAAAATSSFGSGGNGSQEKGSSGQQQNGKSPSGATTNAVKQASQHPASSLKPTAPSGPGSSSAAASTGNSGSETAASAAVSASSRGESAAAAASSSSASKPNDKDETESESDSSYGSQEA